MEPGINYLTADAIFGAEDLISEDVRIPEWGGHLRIHRLDSAELLAVLTFAGRPDFNEQLLQATARHPDGSPVFATADLPRLRRKSGTAFLRACRVAQRLNGLTVEAQADAGKD